MAKPATWLFGNRKMQKNSGSINKFFNVGEVVVFCKAGRDYVGTVLEDRGTDWLVLDRRNKKQLAWKGATRPLHGKYQIV